MRVGATSSAINLNAQRHIGINQTNLGKALERLSSGVRINRAADDAAGMAVSEAIRTQVRGLAQGSANSDDGINLLKTADGGLQEMQDMLHRMRDLVIQAANQTYTDQDRQKIQGEIAQLTQNFDEIATNTEFNGIKMLKVGLGFQDGSTGIYVGAGIPTPTVAAVPTVPAVFTAAVPTVPAVITPMVPTIMSSAASLYTVIGTQFQPAGITIDVSSLGGIAVDNAGNLFIAGSDTPGGSLPSARPHAIIKIDPATGTDTNYGRTTANTAAAGIAFDSTTNSLVFTTNSTGGSLVQRITAGGVAGAVTAATIIHNLNGGATNQTFFATGIQVDSTGTIQFGSASPLYDPAVVGSGAFQGSDRNNIWTITGATARVPNLVESGTPFGATSPLLSNAASNGGLHNDSGLPNNVHETTGNGFTSPAVNMNGDNLFVQDFARAASGALVFTSRMTAPFEFDSFNNFDASGPLPAAGKLFISTPPGAGGVTITEIDLSGAPAAAVNPPVRFGGVAIDSVSGDVFVSDRDNNRVLRIANAGQPTQSITAISVGVPVVGMAFNNTTHDLYMSTLTNNNEVWTLAADIPMVPTVIVSATVPMVPGTLVSATVPMVPTVPAVPGSIGTFMYTDGSLHIQTGANEAQDIRIKVTDMGLGTLKLEGLDVSLWGTNPYGVVSTDQYVSDVNYDLRRIDDAMSTISTARATFGAYLNRLEHARSNVDNAGVQQAASESRIRDTDMAKETSVMVRNQILTQASTDMLGQVQKVQGQLVMGLISNIGR